MGLATPLQPGPVIQGIQVSWGMTEGPKWIGHMIQSASIDDAYDTQEKYRDTNGKTETYVFDDALQSGECEVIVKAGTPLPAPGEMIVETDTGQKWLILTRGRSWTNNGTEGATFTLERGEGALFQ